MITRPYEGMPSELSHVWDVPSLSWSHLVSAYCSVCHDVRPGRHEHVPARVSLTERLARLEARLAELEQLAHSGPDKG